MNDSTTAVLTILVIGLLYLGANWIDKNSKFQNIIIDFSIGTWYTYIVERDRKLIPIKVKEMFVKNCDDVKTFLLYKEEYFEIGELIDIFEEECKYVHGMRGEK